jgi:Trypsin-like peptidase domain
VTTTRTVRGLAAAALTVALAGCGLPLGPARTGGEPVAVGTASVPAAAAPSSTAPPARALAALLFPLFRTAKGSAQQDWAAGSAFALRAQGRTLLVTAFHLFGPDGGVPRQLTMAEVRRTVRGVDARRPAVGAEALHAGRPLEVPDAAPHSGDGDLSHDIALFPITRTGTVTVLELAARAPEVGDRVFVPWTRDGRGVLLGGTLVVVRDDRMLFELDDPTVPMNGTSGAPILDVRGDVVGVNLVGGRQDGKAYAGGSVLANVRAAVTTALARRVGANAP